MNFAMWLQVLIYFVCITIRTAKGSEIIFESTPNEILDGLTGTIDLRCSLNDTAVSPSIIGRRDVQTTVDNVEDVSSIIVMKNGRDVASVSHKHGAKVMGVASNLKVVGDVSGSSGERGFLQLTYKAPSQGESGEYVCEINVVNESGHARVLSTSLEISVSTPTVPDIIKYIRELEERSQNERESLQQVITANEKRLQNVEHVESGTIYCGRSSTWTDTNIFPYHESLNVTTGHTRDISVKFQRNYNMPPIVNLGLIENDSYFAINTRYTGTVVSVNTNGFTIRCATWADSEVYQLGFSWISVPKITHL